MINTINKGKAAEHIVIAKFLKAGYNVYTPVAESTKVDLIVELDNVYHKIQVKAFGFNKTNLQIQVRKIGVNTKTNTKISYYTAQDVDYFAAVDVKTDEVFLVPISVVQQYRSSISKSACYENPLIVRL